MSRLGYWLKLYYWLAFWKIFCATLDIRLLDLKGGTMPSSIPREAFAALALPRRVRTSTPYAPRSAPTSGDYRERNWRRSR
ncbi:hypothetical protein, partial [Sodalis-like endosymbiont of Proechinophthirus fluctus]|uniref:hypothetical protein n=1 Tax=Sodalis-like endosymbiont of Proechinophthirus fluctus TaxID=1462730 RepID=UPI001956F71A